MFRNIAVSYMNFVPRRFAGHSKWQNIRHIKGAKDAERNLVFNRLSRQIKVAVVEGGSLDPKSNVKLSQIIDQCKRVNMPLATLQSVLKSCENDKSNAKCYIVDIKSKYAEGSGMHMFEEKGIIEAENSQLSPKADEGLELATEHAIECNAEEVTYLGNNTFQFLCDKHGLLPAQHILQKLGYTIVTAAVDYCPIKMQALNSEDLEYYEKLMKKLDEMPEVVRLFDNVSES